MNSETNKTPTVLISRSEEISSVRSVNQNPLLIIKPTRCTNFSNLFLE